MIRSSAAMPCYTGLSTTNRTPNILLPACRRISRSLLLHDVLNDRPKPVRLESRKRLKGARPRGDLENDIRQFGRCGNCEIASIGQF